MPEPAELPFSARFFGSRTNEGVDRIDIRTPQELLASASWVEQPGAEAENRDPESLANATYQKWYARCLQVFSSNEHYRYEHPSEEIRLELLCLPSLEDDDLKTPPKKRFLVCLSHWKSFTMILCFRCIWACGRKIRRRWRCFLPDSNSWIARSM